MNGLINITLIKSAQFDFTSLELEGNTLFIGANGAGKTTLLRAILFFYTVNTQALGISRSKKISFSDYYFEYENSYIVYTYKKDNKFIVVIVYKDSNIKFRFAMFDERPNLKDIFIKDNKPLLAGQLWLKLREISNLSNIIQNGEVYKEILYGKNPKLRYLSLFETKEFNSFTKTLSNIFINSKVDSDGIKKVIISSLGVDSTIDIQQLLRLLKNFRNSYEDIKSFEEATPRIKNLVKELSAFEESKSLLAQELMSLHFSKTLALSRQKELNQFLEALAMQKNSYEIELDMLTKKHKKIEILFNNQVGEFNYKLKEIEKKKLFYKEENIDKKMQEHKTLELKKEELKVLTSQQAFLLREHEDIQASHVIQVQKINNQFEEHKNSLDKEMLELKTQRDKEISQIKDIQIDKLQEIKKDFFAKKEIKTESSYSLKFKSQEILSDQKALNIRSFIFEDETKLSSLISVQTKSELLVKDAKSKMKQLDFQLSLEKKNIEDTMHSKSAFFDNQIENISKDISKLEKMLSPIPNTLIDKIYKQSAKSDFYIHFLRDEILHTDLDIEFVDFNNAIFEIDLKSYHPPKNEISKKIQILKTQLAQLLKEKNKSLDELTRELKNKENAVYREKRVLDETIKENQLSLSATQSKINALNNKKAVAQKNFNDDKNRELKRFEELLNELKNQKNLLQNEIAGLEKLSTNREKSLKSDFTKQINIISAKYDSKMEQLLETLDEIKKQKVNQSRLQLEYYEQKLRDKSIDIHGLKILEEKISLISNDIEQIEKYVPVIIRFKEDKKEFLDKESEYQKLLKNLKKEFEEKETLFNHTLANLQEKIKSLIDNISSVDKEIIHNNNQILDVELFEKSPIFRRCRSLNLEYKSNDISDCIKNIIERLSNLDEQYTNIEKKIATYLSKLAHLFDTSLSIKSATTPLSSAYTLQEFFQMNKIEHVKELLGDQIGNIIKHIITTYDNLLTSNGKIKTLISKINKLFEQINISVISALELRYQESNHKIIEILNQIKIENNETHFGYGKTLFDDDSQSTKNQLILLHKLIETIEYENISTITLEDTFILEFRVVENGNDSKFVSSLDAIGSNGTDILVKGMIYIAMLRIFKEKLSKIDLSLQVVLDEIGILSQRYLKELISFANQYGIFFINGAPDEKLINTYKRVCLVRRIGKKASAQEVLIYDEK